MALVLAPEMPLGEWLSALDAQMERSPNFFDARPVVVDLGALPREQTGIAEFLQLLEQRGIRIIGTEGAHPAWNGIEAWGRPLPGSSKPGREIEAPGTDASGSEPPGSKQAASTGTDPTGTDPTGTDPTGTDPTGTDPPVVPAANADANALVLDQPVRSGQSVVFDRGDITILGSVASGAEVMAGGSVHIYGTLRGRAIAGLAGHPGARIFCHKLQAELLAIDGVYQTADDMPAEFLGRSVHVRLEGEQLKLTVLE